MNRELEGQALGRELAPRVEPYYVDDDVTLYLGDCREILPLLDEVDAVVTDPPYGDTSLEWDRWVSGWAGLLPSTQAWVFGSMRMWLGFGGWEFHHENERWKFAQDIVWRKHNGSGFHSDRFKRVHEHALHFYKGAWDDVYKSPVYTLDAVAKAVRKKGRPAHTGNIDATPYHSEDGGPRLQRSVLDVRSCHGYAVHPTQKPVGILTPLIEYSVPVGGTVLDPFAGSGSTLVAARMVGRRAVGIEGREDYCEAAVKRLAQRGLFAGGAA